ncbi:hypothetical protein SAMN05428975_5534 [Mucilaginibacter sp. OK268]|nr:hypothetical protein SAMN05428975_5534 [Mucilaginibacter sp. OK268]
MKDKGTELLVEGGFTKTQKIIQPMVGVITVPYCPSKPTAQSQSPIKEFEFCF